MTAIHLSSQFFSIFKGLDFFSCLQKRTEYEIVKHLISFNEQSEDTYLGRVVSFFLFNSN